MLADPDAAGNGLSDLARTDHDNNFPGHGDLRS
jgi:hypothetical protein